MVLGPSGTEKSRAHMARVASLGCLAGGAGHQGECRGKCDAHHIIGLAYRGKSQKASDYETIPLCVQHHTGEKGKVDGIAIHRSELDAWEAKYGTQEHHLTTTRLMLQLVYPDWDHLTGESYHGAAGSCD